jgi:hypothetical protein
MKSGLNIGPFGIVRARIVKIRGEWSFAITDDDSAVRFDADNV